MPATPWSQPGMTAPAPSWNVNGSPRSHEESNCRPLTNETPTYWTETCLPRSATAPLPTLRSLITSFLGALPLGTLTAGLVASGVEAASGVDVEAGSSESESPQPATASSAAHARASRVRGRGSDGIAPQGRRCSRDGQRSVPKMRSPASPSPGRM
jgi:hypothetical protein